MEYIVITKSEKETIILGKKIGSFLTEPSLILLEGQLGVGKTTLTKGIAQGLGIKGVVNSPTFTLLKVYDDYLYHMDLYRSNEHDFDLEEYIDEHICVIEWPNYNYLPKEYLKIEISSNDDKREFKFLAKGQSYEKLLGAIKCEA